MTTEPVRLEGNTKTQPIARVLKALDDHRQTNNTAVIFMSDNGGEHLSDTWPFT